MKHSRRFAQGARHARAADVTIKIEVSQQAQAMLDEADERWCSAHGFEADNPLLDEVARAAELLRDNPEIGVRYRENAFRLDVRRLLLRSGWHLYYSYDAVAHQSPSSPYGSRVVARNRRYELAIVLRKHREHVLGDNT
jgi:hypothetical protein